jgi:hypothetical protein
MEITEEKLKELEASYARYVPEPGATWKNPKWPWERMEVGDSTLISCECRCYKTLFNMLNAYRKATGRTFRIFSLDTLKSHWRVWRIK